MQCEICERWIKKGYTISELWDDVPQHICAYCYMKYPLVIKEVTLPIDESTLDVISLNPPMFHKPLAYLTFYRPYIIGFLMFRHHDLILIFDNLNEEVYTLIDTLKLGSIYLLTLYLSID